MTTSSLSEYIYIYIYTYINLQNHSGDRTITKSYTVQKPQTESNCKYIQSYLLNISMGDKQNDAVIVNPKNNKENMKIHTRNHVHADIHMHIYSLVKYRARESFMMRSFIFDIQNKSFHDRVIYLVQ